MTRDPVTGELRSATAEERRQLGLEFPTRKSERPERIEIRPDGGYSVVVHPSAMSYSVVSQGSDGTSTTRCVSAEEIETGVATVSPLKHREEASSDR